MKIVELALKIWPWYDEESAKKAMKEKEEAEKKPIEYPDELYLYPDMQRRGMYSNSYALVLVPQPVREKCIALDDVSNPKEVTVYKKVRTMWIVRNSEVVEVPKPKKEDK